MSKKLRVGGIFPPCTLVFPPFAYGAGQALSAVSVSKRFKSIARGFSEELKKTSYFPPFPPFARILNIRVKRWKIRYRRFNLPF